MECQVGLSVYKTQPFLKSGSTTDAEPCQALVVVALPIPWVEGWVRVSLAVLWETFAQGAG